jgi:hypothetical protein
VKSRLASGFCTYLGNEAHGESDSSHLEVNKGQVLGSKTVDLKHGRVIFWFLKRIAGKNIDFEFSFLQGAAAAVVVLELSDRETIHMTKELLRDICKLFSIPVMLVVGGTMQDDLVAQGSPTSLEEIALRVVSFAYDVRTSSVRAS